MNENTMFRFNGSGVPSGKNNADSSLKNNLSIFSTGSNESSTIMSKLDQKYRVFDHYITINSAKRDIVNHPLHYSFRINLKDHVKNVKEVELINAIIPNTPGLKEEPFILLDVSELNHISVPGNPNDYFTVISTTRANDYIGNFISPNLGSAYRTSKVFRTPATLSSITINVRDQDGNLYDFGTPGGSTAKNLQSTFVFRVRTEEVDRSAVSHRNVF